MMLRFEQPGWLLLLAAAIPLVIVGWRAAAGFDFTRRVTALLLRAGLLAAVAFALAQPRIVREHHQLTVVGLLDVSASVRRFANLPEIPELGRQSNLEYLRQWFRNAVDIKQDDDRFGLIVFDGQAAVIATPSRGIDLANAPLDVQRVEGTNISRAIELALAMFPGDTARRIVLVSDGNETLGNAQLAAQQAAGAGAVQVEAIGTDQLTIPIDVLPIAYNVAGDVQVVRVEAPPNAQPEQTVSVRMVLEATQPTRGRLTLTNNGLPVDLNGAQPGRSREVALSAGQSVHVAQVALPDESVNQFEASFEADVPAEDALVENNSAEAFTITPSRGRIMIVDRLGEEQLNPLAQMLEEAGLRVSVVAPGAFPQTIMRVASNDLVILDNIASYDLTLEQHALLARFVNDLGGGLIMSGGTSSFGPGGWAGTQIEPLLPLLLDPPKELRLPSAALVLVIDKSGSMHRPVGGARASQQEVANEGAALAIESLRKDSLVGVVAFDLFAQIVVPLQINENPRVLAEQVRGIRADGGTNLAPALERAFAMLRDVEVEKKRVVCLTDGQTEGGDLEGLVRRMREADIRVTTIAVGDQADYQQLERLAEIGEGEFYPVRNPKILPRVLVDSVQIINKPLIKEGTFVPQVRPTGSAIAAGLDNASAPLEGLVITAPRPDPRASLEMIHPDGEPLLAQWQAGLGRVAAFTSDALGQWSSAWVDYPAAQSFWTQLARLTSRPPATREAELVTRIVDDELQIELSLVPTDESDDASAARELNYATVTGTVYRPDGEAVPVRLPQVGPERFATTIPADQSGNYIATLTANRPGLPPIPVFGGASRSTSAELRRYQSNVSLLQEIAQQTGGRQLLLDDPQAVNMFDRSTLPRSRSLLPIWRDVLLWAVALLLLDVACRRIAWSAAGVRALAGRAFARVASTRQQGERAIATTASLRNLGQRFQRPAVQERDATESRRPRIDRSTMVTSESPDAPGAFAEGEMEARAAAAEQLAQRKRDRQNRVAQPNEERESSATERAASDPAAVRSALDALFGRRKSSVSDTTDDDGQAGKPDQEKGRATPDTADETPDVAPGETTSSLLEARRRAREQRERGD